MIKIWKKFTKSSLSDTIWSMQIECTEYTYWSNHSSKLVSNDYRTWAGWAYASSRTLSHFSDLRSRFTVNAISGFLKATQLRPSESLEYLCQMFSIFFRYGEEIDLPNNIKKDIISLPPTIINQIIPQIVVHISDKNVREVVQAIINNFGSKHFQAVVFALNVLSLIGNGDISSISSIILTFLSWNTRLFHLRQTQASSRGWPAQTHSSSLSSITGGTETSVSRLSLRFHSSTSVESSTRFLLFSATRSSTSSASRHARTSCERCFGCGAQILHHGCNETRTSPSQQRSCRWPATRSVLATATRRTSWCSATLEESFTSTSVTRSKSRITVSSSRKGFLSGWRGWLSTRLTVDPSTVSSVDRARSSCGCWGRTRAQSSRSLRSSCTSRSSTGAKSDRARRSRQASSGESLTSCQGETQSRSTTRKLSWTSTSRSTRWSSLRLIRRSTWGTTLAGARSGDCFCNRIGFGMIWYDIIKVFILIHVLIFNKYKSKFWYL